MARNDKKRKSAESSSEPASASVQYKTESSRSSPPPAKKVRWGGPQDTNTTTNDSEEEEERAPFDDKTCLAAYCLHGRLGCAYYDPVKARLYVLEDTQETNHLDLTKMLLEQADADVVITSSKSDEHFIDVVKDCVDTAGGTFQIRPHKEFVSSKGRDRMLSLRILSELTAVEQAPSSESDSATGSGLRNAYEFMKQRTGNGVDPTTQKWNAAIRLSNFACAESSPICIAAVGALLDHLVRERAVHDLDDEGISGLDIRDIEALAINEVMQINSDALSSLQIFELENHASVHSDKTKEGLSVFSILNRTKTTLGRDLLKTWFLRPSMSIPVITSRHDAIACFQRSENLTASDVMHNHLKGIKNVPKMLSTMKSGRATLKDWQGIVKFTYHTTMLREAVTELHAAHDVDVVRKLTDALDVASFREVGTKINETIDWEESLIAGRVCVRPHIDEDLDHRKHIYHGIDSILSNVAHQISPTVPPDFAATLNVVYFPQLGFLICIPMLQEWEEGGEITVLDGWSFQFSSEGHVYFKSQQMRGNNMASRLHTILTRQLDMDEHIGDLHPLIVDREIEIVQDLLEQILQHSATIAHACDVCAEVDCLLSFAEASAAFDYRRPHMVESDVLHVEQGRHPLQEQIIDTFVPNDTHIIGGRGFGCLPSSEDEDSEMHGDSVLLCTGANACGKSVYLKQIVLIQFMAQIGWKVQIQTVHDSGCFVPAQSATLGIVDKIFTRISTRESVSKVQSAFMIDLNQVSIALRNATRHSLILMDEFGKGTSPTDGAALLCGVLNHLLERGEECPKVLAATHFHDVFRTDLLDPDSVPISFLHMQVMFTSATTGQVVNSASNTPNGSSSTNNACPGEKITYLYRVAKGLSLDSHAAKCAEIFGVPSRTVQRAQYVSHLISTHELGTLLDEEMTEKERLDLEDAELVCRRFIAWNLEDGASHEHDEMGGLGTVHNRLATVLGKSVDAEV